MTYSESEFDESLDELIGRAADEYSERIARGEVIDIEEFITRFPAAAQQLRRILSVVEIARDESPSQSGIILTSAFGDQATGTQLGDFRLIRPIGQGGMGVVHEAEQISMGRRVALKILPFASLLAPQRLARFQNEVRAAALLDHPNIVSVYAVGEERGVHYFAMQLVRGRSLAEVIESLQDDCTSNPSVPNLDHLESKQQRAKTLSDRTDTKYFRELAKIGIQIASALQHAHQRGVVHRDIKPANVLIDSSGTAFVTDFGLAHMENQASITAAGDLVGTLRYMSPEQASGESHFVDFRTDIYSLGATLYELAALSPAFHGTSRPQLITQISSGSFPPPRTVRACIPRDLETIILRAMAYAPEERYGSAQEVAEDLRAFLDHRPVRASRPGLREKTAKWLSRHPGTTVMAVVMSVLLAAALGVVTVVIEQSKEQLELANQRAEMRAAEAVKERDAKESLLFAADLKLASEALREARVGSARERLERHVPRAGEPDRRNFAWHYLWSELRREQLTISWGEPLRDASFGPRGNLIAVAHDSGRVTLWNRATEQVAKAWAAHDDVVQRVAFSPDGNVLASASDDGTIGLWEVSSGELLYRIEGHTEGVVSLCWGADGTLYTAGDREVKQWQAPWQIPLTTFRPLKSTIVDLDVASDQSLLAVTGANPNSVYAGLVSVWNVPAATLALEIPHASKGTAIAFHPEAKKLAVGTQMGDLLLWDVATPDAPVATATGHTNVIYDLAFSSDGSTLASSGKDMTVRLWSAESGELRQAYLSHTRRVLSVDYDVDNSTLITASADGSCRFWDVRATGYHEAPVPFGVGNHDCPYHHDGQFFVFPTYGQSGLFHPETNRWTPSPIAIWQYAFMSSETDQLVITGGEDGLYEAVDQGTRQLARDGRASSDMDGDGDLDVYAAFGTSHTILWQERNAEGELLAATVRGDGLRPPMTMIADHNRDGRFDLMYINRWEGVVDVNRERRPYRGDDEDVLIRGIPNHGLIAFDDFDGDARLDFVAIEPESGAMTAYFCRLTRDDVSEYTRVDLGKGPVAATDVVSGDIDHDGDIDLVILASGTNTIRCYANDSNGTFQPIQQFDVSLPIWKLDLVRHTDNGEHELLAAGPEGVLRFRAGTPCFSATSSVVHDLSELPISRPIPSNIAVYDLSKQRIVNHFFAHNHPRTTAISPLGDEIVTASSHPLICFWDTSGKLTGSIRKNTTQITRMLYTADGARLCVANGDVLRIYDVKKCELLHECLGHENTIAFLVLLDKERMVITASEDLTIRVWSLDTGRILHTMVGHRTVPTYLALSSDARLLASGDQSGVVKLWDLETGSELLELSDFRHVVRGLAFTSPDVLTVIGSDLDPLQPRQTFIGRWQVRPESQIIRIE